MASSNSASKDVDEGRPIFPNDQNVLQKHVAFFDRDNDGLVYPWETFEGFRAIGAGYLLSIASSIFINMALSGVTRPGKSTNLLFPIEVKNIHMAKHGSDSGVYDSDGSKFAGTHDNALTGDELKAMLKANREPKDYKGWLAGYAEWITLYNLCKDKNGLLRKEIVKAVYDGSLFEQMERERAAAKKKA
ncbi:Caleosin [Corchorus olitorius]|uniref:Caleosin n=1 Tax=Corchorus olitorius TaxID=93759 RepID=A0A1R3JGR1_9ROSI|nr:Caleosin [Corchorus olitorius]